MKLLTELLSELIGKAFGDCGYEESFGVVISSNRLDLCQFQCNGALAGAKLYKKAPMQIAQEIIRHISENKMIHTAVAVAPGYINLTLNDAFLLQFVQDVYADKYMGIPQAEHREVIVLDYGNPNVAKPLHVGHLRSAINGEALKRIVAATGRHPIGDVHQGDWGLPMGLVLAELEERYGDDCPVLTTELLNELYPFASQKSKENAAFLARAQMITAKLQKGDPHYRSQWESMVGLSICDIRTTFSRLGAMFDYWFGESDASKYVPELIHALRDRGLLTESEGAQVVDVVQESDRFPVPPVIVVKSNGSEGYATTDLAAIIQRQKDFTPDKIWYIVDFRQNMHFTQVFRVARSAALVPAETELTHLCFGTVNGKDGKPFKTRDGGVMKLSELLDTAAEYAYANLRLPDSVDERVKKKTAEKIGIAAIKFGDLINHYSKDCIFDIDKFMSSEGKTGVYLLYVIARINSIIRKLGADAEPVRLHGVYSEAERELMLKLALSSGAYVAAFNEKAPNVLCENAYQLAVAFSRFYHTNRIIAEPDEQKRMSWLSLCVITKKLLLKQLNTLAIEAVDVM